MTLLATFFSIGLIVLFLDRLGLISSVLQEQFQLGWNLQLLAFGLLLFDAVAAILLAAVVTRPYLRDALFTWEVEPFDGELASTATDIKRKKE